MDLSTLRHSTAHVMAQAVTELYPDAKLGIGPAIEDGFYYDFDVETPFTELDLNKITKRMKKIIARNIPFEKRIVSKADASAYMNEHNQIYKTELINELDDEEISFYSQGNFTDLCRGPHIEKTNSIKAFKLLKVSGAYWRGSEKNKMLQRIYGTAFFTKDELDNYIHLIEEAQKRDHRKIGKQLDLFSFHQEAPGLPFFHGRGMVIWNELLNYWQEEHEKQDYQSIKTPVLLSKDLWVTSGHWDNYQENMYTTNIDDAEYAVKPMNCPGSILLYKEKIHSYRNFPLRMGEIGLVHRHEKKGVLSGLFRVRGFHQDDAHIFMTKEQITDEILNVLKIVEAMYTTFGLEYHLELSTKPEKYIGSDEAWEYSTNALKKALEESQKPFTINEGDGAFYGPKIDIHIKDALKRTWQCGTIQLDMNLPERFDLSYINSNNEKARPVMIHRVIYGSMERFIGIITEHLGGNFPLWLAPEQVRIIPVSNKFLDYGEKISKKLKNDKLRFWLDDRNEKLGHKIREAELMKIPYVFIIGENESSSDTVSVRHRFLGDTGQVNSDKIIQDLKTEINTRRLLTQG
jgi:threonyl-tRNA synthetase